MLLLLVQETGMLINEVGWCDMGVDVCKVQGKVTIATSARQLGLSDVRAVEKQCVYVWAFAFGALRR
jgi:hypothetical protein